MPKRKHSNSNEIQVLDEKDIKKIQRLIQKSNADETESSRVAPIQIPISAEDEYGIDVEAISYKDNDICEDEEWKKFFQTSADSDFKDKFQEKLVECRELVNDEVSEFCGSIPGDLEGIDNFENLPEEIKHHINLLKSVLRNYRSGPLPKTVKVLPCLPGWDGLMEMLDPMSWTPHAHMRVAKVFASKGHEPSLHYYENYLLKKVQDDILTNKRLSFHLLEALIHSMFRPQEFIAGIFLPWIRSEMSKTEGIVLAHLMKKASLKPRFGTVCLALACKENFSIPRSLVVESLLEKHYNMPEAAIGVLVNYFASMDRDCTQFYNDEGRLPVSWFKSLSTFLELYRDAVIPSERERLVKVCRRQEHPFFTKQIRAYIQMIPTEQKI